LLVDQVRAVARLELHQGLLALLDHFLENAQYLGVVEADALIDLALLDRRGDHAYDAEAILLAGAHRRLHVIGNSLFQRHRGSNALGSVGPGGRRRRRAARSTAGRTAHVLARQTLQMALDRSRLLSLT